MKNTSFSTHERSASHHTVSSCQSRCPILLTNRKPGSRLPKLHTFRCPFSPPQTGGTQLSLLVLLLFQLM